MKKQVLILIAVLLTTNYVKAQINANPDPDGPVWMTGDCNPMTECSFNDIPVLHLSDTSQNTDLPQRVRNDTLKFFPPVYDQGSVYCCTFASEIGYIFTYEMNRKRDASAGSAWSLTNGLDTIDLRNLYHPLFGYNFINDGNYLDKTCQTDGFKLLQSIGCPMYNYYYANLSNLPGSVKAKYWMSSFDGYADAIRQKVDSIYQIQFNPYFYNTFDTLKHWLYDHNEGEGNIGGLASIAILTGGDSIVTLQNGDSMYYRLGTDQETGHVVTIVGYDDEICYDLNHNGHIEQDEYGAFRVANSWGTNWGSGGFIWLPYKLMRNLQDNRRMAFCCTVKECEPKVYVKGTWVHPHQYARRTSFKFTIEARAQSNYDFSSSEEIDYPIFHNQGGYNSLQGINNEDTLAFCLDYSNYHQGANHVGRYFIDAYNLSGTSGNKLLGLTLVDCRWNEVFELPFDEDTVEIDSPETVVDIKYDLIPFGSLCSISYNRELVTRRTVNLSGNAIVTMNKPTIVNMYGTDLFDNEIIVGENATLQLDDSVRIIAQRGNCRILVKGTMTLGKDVTFEARDGATLEIIFDNDTALNISGAHFINCNLVLPQKNISLFGCEFKGTPLEIRYLSSEITGEQDTTVIVGCNFDPNGQSIQNAVYVKECSYYSITGCNVSDTCCGGSFVNGILLQNCGTSNGMATVRDNDIMDCTGTGLLMYNSRGDVTVNRIHDNGYGVKLLNNCNIGQFSGRCEVEEEKLTQYIIDNTYNEVFMTGSSIPQTFRYNAIHDDDNVPFVYHDGRDNYSIQGDTINRSSIDVTYNYWGTNFVSTTHLYTNLQAGYIHQPTWVMGTCDGNSVDDGMLLRQADSLYDTGNFSSAKSLYMQVVEGYPTTVSAETALKTLLELEQYAGNDYESLQEYYLTEENIQSDVTLSHLASSLANRCDEIMENYSKAIAWYEAVLSDPETSFNDSIFAAIDLGDLYLRMAAGGEKATGKLTQYKPESETLHKKQTDYALLLLPCKDNFKLIDEASDSLYVTDMITGLNESMDYDGITVAPNPTNGQVTITGENLRQAEVVNMLGQRVATVAGDGDMLHIDMAKLHSGVYFVNITDSEGRKCVRKVVKE